MKLIILLLKIGLIVELTTQFSCLKKVIQQRDPSFQVLQYLGRNEEIDSIKKNEQISLIREINIYYQQVSQTKIQYTIGRSVIPVLKNDNDGVNIIQFHDISGFCNIVYFDQSSNFLYFFITSNSQSDGFVEFVMISTQIISKRQEIYCIQGVLSFIIDEKEFLGLDYSQNSDQLDQNFTINIVSLNYSDIQSNQVIQQVNQKCKFIILIIFQLQKRGYIINGDDILQYFKDSPVRNNILYQSLIVKLFQCLERQISFQLKSQLEFHSNQIQKYRVLAPLNNCPTNCTCSPPNSSSCTGCTPNYYYSSSTCLACSSNCQTCTSSTVCTKCQGPYTLVNNVCQPCPYGQYQSQATPIKCTNCIANCQICTDGTTCTTCNNGFILATDTMSCYKCNNTCLTCNGPAPTQCLTCSSGKYLTATNTCDACDNSCATCNGATAQQCVTCSPGKYLTAIYTCAACDNNCVTCQTSATQCLTCTTGKTVDPATQACVCKVNYYQNGNICSACDSTCNGCTGSSTTQCIACSSSYSYQIMNSSGTFTCSSTALSGYNCNTSKVCYACSVQNCSTCPTLSTCTLCKTGFYVWVNTCVNACPSSKGLQISSSTTQCECLSNYIYYQPQNICILILSIVSINLTTTDLYNVVTVNFNRTPYPSEMSTISMLIDPSKLILNTDYTIANTYQQQAQVIFDISVTENRKINSIVIYYNQKSQTFPINNAILTTAGYNQYSQSLQSKMSSMNSASSALTPTSGATYTIINTLKNLQIICMLSNFVQLLGPLIVFNQYLPQPIYIGTILGASFIFKNVPSSSQLNTSTSASQQSEQLLQALGMRDNIYETFLFPHLALLASVFIIIFCLVSRYIMKGKQYTMTVVNLFVNTMSSLHQGYITCTLFSIYYSINYSSQQYYAIIQLLAHLVFVIVMTIFVIKQDMKYIENNIPNFILNLNIKSRGWRTYLSLSYLKKYICIISILLLQQNPLTCGVLISCLFFVFAIYLLYFRFFTHWFFTYYKFLQELLIATTIAMFTYCTKKYEDLLSQDTILDSDLININSISYVVLIMFACCLLASLILFLIRTINQLYLVVISIQKYLQERNLKQKMLEDLELYVRSPQDNNDIMKETISIITLKDSLCKRQSTITSEIL